MASPSSLSASCSSLESLSSSYPKDYNNYGTRIIHRKPSIRSMARSESRPTQISAARHFSCDSSSSDGEMRPGYFLDSCFLCRTRLGARDDIYMYRGDTPFCSEECRQEQIDIDEAEERNRMKNTSKKNSTAKIISNSTVSSKSHDIHARAAQTVVAR